MGNTKIDNLVETVNSIVENDGSDTIKRLIGDSRNNNRTLSVRQVIRYFNAVGEQNLAQSLSQAYTTLLRYIKHRRRNTNRTDAVDLSEFVTAATSAPARTRRRLGHLL